MSIVVDFYLRDQIIRGELLASQGRPLDLLNNRLENYILLTSALARSLHVAAEPTRLGQTRIHKDHLLLVIPHDEAQEATAPIRGGWIEKREARVVVGLGPLTVTGNLHFGQWESVSLDAISRNADGRAFLPATAARVTALYHPNWVVEAPSVLVARAAMGYISLLSVPSEETPPHGRLVDEIYRPLRPPTPIRR